MASLKYIRDRHRECPSKEIPDPSMQKLVELERKISAVTQENELPIDPKSPFMPKIDRVRADLTKKMPPLETYDGTGDPYDHTHI